MKNFLKEKEKIIYREYLRIKGYARKYGRNR